MAGLESPYCRPQAAVGVKAILTLILLQRFSNFVNLYCWRGSCHFGAK